MGLHWTGLEGTLPDAWTIWSNNTYQPREEKTTILLNIYLQRSAPLTMAGAGNRVQMIWDILAAVVACNLSEWNV